MSRLHPKASEDSLDPSQRPISPSVSIASPRSQQTVVPMSFTSRVNGNSTSGGGNNAPPPNGELEGHLSPPPKRARKHSKHTNPNGGPLSPNSKGEEIQGLFGQMTSPDPPTIDALLSNLPSTSSSNGNSSNRIQQAIAIPEPSPLGSYVSMTPGGLDDVTALSSVPSYLPSPQTDINTLPGRPIQLPLRGPNFSTRTPPPLPKGSFTNPTVSISSSGSGGGHGGGASASASTGTGTGTSSVSGSTSTNQTYNFVRTRQYSHTPSPPAASFKTPDGDVSRSPTEVYSEVGTIGAVPSLAEGSELSTPVTNTTTLPALPLAVDGLKEFILRETHNRFPSQTDFTPSPMEFGAGGVRSSHPYAYTNGRTTKSNTTSVVNEKTFSSESTYARQRRNLLDILSRLHSTGVQKDIDLPQIVVIGSQSVGKSSLIESMSGITLPRDAGACTRCPLECRLEYSSSNWSCRVFLRLERDPFTGLPLDKVEERQFGPIITNSAEVENVLRRAQRALLRPTLDYKLFLNDQDLNISDPPALSFTSNCVCMHITGPDVPDLYFYDLPGIIANIREGGNIKDIELVRELVKSYISRPSCLILLVVSCETDFENQGAGRLALEADPTGQRIIGVLTKPDRIENTTGDKWAAVLRNEDNRLANGWFCVKQPDPIELKQEKISWEEARAREESFFSNVEPWKNLDETFRMRLGSLNLIRFLSRLLSRFIALRLPELEKELDGTLEDINRRLSDLPVPRYEDPCTELVDLVFDFGRTLSNDIRGTPSLKFDGSPSRSLMQNIRAAQVNLRSTIVRTAPKFCPWSRQDSTPHSSPGTSNRSSLSGLSSIGVPMNWVAEPKFLVKDEQHPFDDRVGRVLYLDEIMEIVEQSVTRELPGDYPTYIIKEEMIRVALRAWRKPMMEYFDAVHYYLGEHVKAIVDDCFGAHAHNGLHTRVLAIVRDQLRILRTRTIQRLHNLFNVEGLPFTLNHTYLKDYKDKLLQHYREIRRMSRGQDLIVRRLTYSGSRSSISDVDELQHRSALPQQDSEFASLVEALQKFGLPCTPADLHRLLPEDECEPALDIMASVRAYFQVAFRRFIDLVALEVDVEFVRGFERSVRSALITGLDIRSPERCAMWLQDSPSIAARRKELLATKQRLEAARSELSSFMLT